MAIIKKSELNASKDELLKRLKDLELSLVKERVIKQGQQGTKIKIKEIRRSIAKIKTILRLKHNIKA